MTLQELAIRRRLLGAVGASLLVVAGSTLFAQSGLITREEALASVFPGAEIASERVFLTRGEQKAAAEIARVDVKSRLVARYVASQEGREIGRAYVDTHVVRTKRESLLISLEANGKLRRIDVTAFLEPREYMAPERWLAQYDGRRLDDDLTLHRAIRPIAGATLTAVATDAAVRRIMAIDQVLEAKGQEP
jgi:hypothetical protein